MDSNERKIVQELVTVLGCVIPASDGYEPRTNLWNKYTAAKNLLAAAPQVVADELTDEKMDALRKQTYDDSQSMKADIYAFGRACYRAALQAAPVQAQEPVACTAVEAVLLSDMVEGSHPQYGNGLFATENCVTTLYRAPVQPVAVPDSWKLVPIEPTEAMVLVPGALRTDGKVARIHRDVWKRMLEAVPSAPAAQGDGIKLTDAEINAIWFEADQPCEANDWTTGPVPFARAIIAAIAAKAAS